MNKHSMRNACITLLLCFIATSVEAATPACIWYAADKALYQIKTDTNAIAQTIAFTDVDGLAMNGSDCGVVVLAKHTLYQFDANAVQTQAIDVRTLPQRLDDPKQILVDPYDKSLWIRDEKFILHLNASGQMIGSWAAPSAIRSFVVALDQSLWVLGNKQLWHYGAQGSLLSSQDLKNMVGPEPKLFAIDSIGGFLWLAGEKQLTQMNLNHPSEPVRNIPLAQKANALTVNPMTGELWLAASDQLLSYGRDGASLHSSDLKLNNLRDVSTLAFDPVASALWVTTERAISRFSAQGQFIASLPAKDADEALAVPAFLLTPILSQVRPAQDGITDDPLLNITYGFDALCNAQSCGFAPNYFSSYTLTATLNQKAISPFVFDGATAQSTYTPATRLPEGTNTLSAQAYDGFSHATNVVNGTFVVDTIPPRFLSITPASGSTVTIPQILLQGVVDDPTAVVVLNGAGMASTTISGTQLNFSIPVALVPGLNTFTLSAVDKAGNSTQQIVSVNYQQIALNVLSPANGVTVAENSVLVSGTYTASEQVGITVNGVVASLIGNTFYANVPLRPGSNKLTAIITSQSGFILSKDINVTRSGNSAFNVVASSEHGLAPSTVSFFVSSQTTAQVATVRADFTGTGQFGPTYNIPNGEIPTTTYTQPGVYQARFEITDSGGNVSTVTKTVFVESVTDLDAMLRASYSSMLQKLMNKDINGALAYIHGNVTEKYSKIFNSLGNTLPSVVPNLGTLGSGQFSEGIAEYVVTRNTSTGKKAFLIYFVQSGDGVWRIEAM